LIAATIQDVANRLDHHPLVPVRRDQRDHGRDECGYCSTSGEHQPVQDRDGDEQHQRRGDQQGELLRVDLEDPLEDTSGVQLGVHAGKCTPKWRR
jgi:hypothetical protein